ncbi:androglobin isoform X1 [Pleurodeles waltl]
MTSKGNKKKDSSSRLSSALGHTPYKEHSSLASSMGNGGTEPKKGKHPIWPEWNDADVNFEKWDAGKGGKEKEKPGKSPVLHFFDDPEGKIELPQVLHVHTWKRPHEFITNMPPVIVKEDTSFDLFTPNDHLFDSELMRWIVSELSALWKIYNSPPSANDKTNTADPPVPVWRPWDHLYALCKAVKGHVPLYNSYGKYVVKLYWMGSWRKITVDDTMPFSEDNQLLLPATNLEAELWPMLLSKALIKLANVTLHSSGKRERGRFTVLHSLTGWLPEVLPLQEGYCDKIWTLLKEILPEFKFPDDENVKSGTPLKDPKVTETKAEDVKNEPPPFVKQAEKPTKDKSEVKDVGKKKGDKDKARSAPHSARQSTESLSANQPPFPENFPMQQSSHMVVYANFLPLNVSEKRISVLGRMADSSECLRQFGLSHAFSHPVLVTRIRSCPLEPPTKRPLIPRWKLVRPKKEYSVISDPPELEEEKEDNFLEISSPFMHFRMEYIPVPCEEQLPSVGETVDVSGSLSRVTQGPVTPQEDNVAQGSANQQQPNPSASNEDNVTESTVPAANAQEKADEQDPTEPRPNLKEVWVDYDIFCKCFQTLYIFHRIYSYPYIQQRTDLKSPEDKGSYYLFVDNLKPTEIVVSFSALGRWGDSETNQKEVNLLPQGKLTAAHFSFKSFIIGPLVLKMHTNAIKATVISLPPGRHLLHFTASAVFAHHIQVCSKVPFVFGEEETVMQHLEKESLRFIEQGARILRAIGNVIHNFSNAEELPAAFQQLELAHYPIKADNRVGRPLIGLAQKAFNRETMGLEQNTDNEDIVGQKHFEAFNAAVWHLFSEVVGNKITSELEFAYRALTLNVEPLRSYEANPISSDTSSEILDSWQSPTTEEEEAATKLQAWWRGTHTRMLWKARVPGTQENAAAKEALQKVWAVLEQNIDHYGAILLRHMFKIALDAVQIYPCYNDEWAKITFADYTVTYSDQPANHWFVVFREVFHVPEGMLLVPKMYTTIPNCFLHVINNDTLEVTPTVFYKVAPYFYNKNLRGYTIVAEAVTGDFPVTAGKWKLRLITSYNPLPSPARDVLNNSFFMKEFKEYFIPNKEHILFRYSVKVSIEHMATIRVKTSKSDVIIKLQILNNEKEVVSTTGKGIATIHAFQFQPTERPLSSVSGKSQTLTGGGAKRKRSSNTAIDKRDKTPSRQGSAIGSQTATEDVISENGLNNHQPHYKYIIQTLVLHNSWILTESEMAFVRGLKESEKNEVKVSSEKHEETSHSPGADAHGHMDSQKSTTAHKTSRKGKEKSAEKEKSSRDKDKLHSAPASRPESRAQPVHEPPKPEWILRIVSDQSEAHVLEVKKDTERADEIKAMKHAWESAEPGRAVKAEQARLQFINKYMSSVSPKDQTETEKPSSTAGVQDHIKTEWPPSAAGLNDQIESEQPPTVTGTKEAVSPSILPGEQPMTALAPAAQPKTWVPLDLTPFIRKTMPEPVLKDETILLQQEMQKAEEIRQYKELREQVLRQREEEQKSRTLLKQRLLQMYDDLQLSLDASRDRILSARDAYRNKLVEAENEKQAALAAQEAALQADLESKSPSAEKKKAQKSAKGQKSAGKKNKLV